MQSIVSHCTHWATSALTTLQCAFFYYVLNAKCINAVYYSILWNFKDLGVITGRPLNWQSIIFLHHVAVHCVCNSELVFHYILVLTCLMHGNFLCENPTVMCILRNVCIPFAIFQLICLVTLILWLFSPAIPSQLWSWKYCLIINH
jgi:hypothetical protein